MLKFIFMMEMLGLNFENPTHILSKLDSYFCLATSICQSIFSADFLLEVTNVQYAYHVCGYLTYTLRFK